MTSERNFNFHLLRISVAQLLKAHGFDKCNNQVLDTVTDLYLKHFQLLLHTVQKYKNVRGDDDDIDEPLIQDIANAFVDLRVIFPSKKLDDYDISPLTNKGIENFEDWFQSEKTTRAREIARPSFEFIRERSLLAKEKSSLNNKMDTFTAAIGQGRPNNDTNNNHNSSSNNNNNNNNHNNNNTTNNSNNNRANDEYNENMNEQEDVEELVVDEDWIKYQLRQQLEEQNLKLSGSILSDYIPADKKQPKLKRPNHDFLISGPTPEKLIDYLPYIKSDDENSDDEDDPDDEIVPLENNNAPRLNHDGQGNEDDEFDHDDEEEDGEEEEESDNGGGHNYNAYGEVSGRDQGVVDDDFGGDIHMVDEDGFDYYEHSNTTASNDLNLFGNGSSMYY